MLSPSLAGCVPPSIARRVAATAIDLIVVNVCWVPGYVVLVFGLINDTVPMLIGGAIAMLLGPLAGIYQWSRNATKGQTIGKKAMGLRLISVDGGAPGWGPTAMRYILFAVTSAFAYIGGIVGLVNMSQDPLTRRAWYDRTTDLALADLKAGKDPAPALELAKGQSVGGPSVGTLAATQELASEASFPAPSSDGPPPPPPQWDSRTADTEPDSGVAALMASFPAPEPTLPPEANAQTVRMEPVTDAAAPPPPPPAEEAPAPARDTAAEVPAPPMPWEEKSVPPPPPAPDEDDFVIAPPPPGGPIPASPATDSGPPPPEPEEVAPLRPDDEAESRERAEADERESDEPAGTAESADSHDSADSAEPADEDDSDDSDEPADEDDSADSAEPADEDATVMRVRRSPAKSGAGFRLDFSDGTQHEVAEPTLIGRNPVPRGNEKVSSFIKVTDPERTVSKTHIRVEPARGGLQVKDRGSSNGTEVFLPDGDSQVLARNTPFVVPDGGSVQIGDVSFTVVALP